MFAHDDLLVEWEIVISGVAEAVTVPVTMSTISYYGVFDEDCYAVLAEDNFSASFAPATISQIADLEVCYPEDITFSWTATYPDVDNIGGDQVLNDSRFTFFSDENLTNPVDLPIGTTIEVTTPVGNIKEITLTDPANTIYGSAWWPRRPIPPPMSLATC